MKPELSIILVNYNERHRLRHLLRLAAAEFSGLTHEIIVVDNASSDGSADMVRQEFSGVRLLEPGSNLMYGKGNNLGLKQAASEWLMIINVDVDWLPGQMNKFFEAAKTKPHLGLAGPRLQYPDGRTQISAHRTFPTMQSVFVDYCLPLQQLLMRIGGHPYQESPDQHRMTHRVVHLTGVCLLLPRAAYEKLGGFDGRFTMYLEETEWQKRMAEAGLDRWLISDANLTHYGAAAKTFAQASIHFLWGLELYTKAHWPGPARRVRLLATIWTAVLISDIVLALVWPLSWLAGRAGRRIRHYARQYLSLTINLFSWPTNPPA